jgi:putative inorganic carbon (hco3(-)) transporter
MFLLAAAPWVALLVLLGVRAPAVLVATYAAIIPFGSSVSLPVGLPSPFNTATTLLGLVTTAGLLAHLLARGGRARAVQGPLPWWLMFFAMLVLTLGWSRVPSNTLDALFVMASLLGLYALASLLDVGRHEARVLEAGISLSGALTGLYALALFLTGSMHIAGDGIPRFQTAGGGGEGGDPNITAASLILPLAVALACGMRPTQPGLQRAAHLVAAGLTGTAITLTGSRGGMVATVAVVLILAANDRRPRALAVYLGVPVLVVLVTFAGAADNLQNRVQSDSTSGRDTIWVIGMRACADHCWRGSGWETFSRVYSDYFVDQPAVTRTRTSVKAHSIWLQVPVEGGILATVAMIGALGVTGARLWRLPSSWRGPPLAAFVGLMVTNTVLGNLAFKYFWLVLMYAAWMDIGYAREWSRDQAAASAEREPAPVSPQPQGAA